MNLAKYGIGLVCVLSAAALIAACGSSSGGGGTGGETSASGGTSSTAQGGASGGSTSSTGGVMCTSIGTPAACPDLVTCMKAHCDTQTTGCFGAAYWQRRIFSGGTCSRFPGLHWGMRLYRHRLRELMHSEQRLRNLRERRRCLREYELSGSTKRLRNDQLDFTRLGDVGGAALRLPEKAAPRAESAAFEG